MTRQSTINLLRSYYAAFNSGDRETLFSLMADDI
ncbi:MAG: isopropylmalate/homocitrate/citramalate synthase, partial [Verrucomicrobiales bacterium VVV1]